MKKYAAVLLTMIVLHASISLSDEITFADSVEDSRLVGLLITKEDLSAYTGEDGILFASCTQKVTDSEPEYSFGEVNGLRLLCFVVPDETGEDSRIISNVDDGICLYHYHDVFWKAIIPEEDSVKNTVAGNIKTYQEMTDGTWKCDGHAYKYRLEIEGRIPNAAVDSSFVFLSNIEEISFEQAYRASGLSSNLDDYFSSGEAVLVEMK